MIGPVEVVAGDLEVRGFAMHLLLSEITPSKTSLVVEVFDVVKEAQGGLFVASNCENKLAKKDSDGFPPH